MRRGVGRVFFWAFPDIDTLGSNLLDIVARELVSSQVALMSSEDDILAIDQLLQLVPMGQPDGGLAVLSADALLFFPGL